MGDRVGGRGCGDEKGGRRVWGERGERGGERRGGVRGGRGQGGERGGRRVWGGWVERRCVYASQGIRLTMDKTSKKSRVAVSDLLSSVVGI